MRTKTLLTAVAALAATVISSEAQTVFSQNVVGYANVVIKGGGAFTLIANPFDDGNGNQLTNILSSALPSKSQVITWNGTGYNTAIVKGGSGFASSVSLPPGTGFFVKNGIAASPDITNTFVGSVVVPVNSSITNTLNGFVLAGSPIPYAGDATTDTNINLGANLANKSQLISWNTGGQVFDTADIKGGTGFGSAFAISVGQGFFIKSQTSTNWPQTLTQQ